MKLNSFVPKFVFHRVRLCLPFHLFLMNSVARFVQTLCKETKRPQQTGRAFRRSSFRRLYFQTRQHQQPSQSKQNIHPSSNMLMMMKPNRPTEGRLGCIFRAYTQIGPPHDVVTPSCSFIYANRLRRASFLSIWVQWRRTCYLKRINTTSSTKLAHTF